MNKTILSLSMLMLGVIIGFSISHFKGANEPASNGSARPGDLKRQLVENHSDSLNTMNQEISTVAGSIVDKSGEGSEGEIQQDKSLAEAKSPDEVLLEILVAIRNEQIALREQIAESNRDIDELTFRVDTHSDSFRPLNTLNQRPRAIEVAEDAPSKQVEESLPPNP